MEFFLIATQNPITKAFTVREHYSFLNGNCVGAGGSKEPALMTEIVEPGMFNGKGNEEIRAQYEVFQEGLKANPDLVEQAKKAPGVPVYVPVAKAKEEKKK